MIITNVVPRILYNSYTEYQGGDRDETQRQMAALLNVGQSTYSMYENGQREIPLAALCKLADHYDVTLDYLVGRSDAPGK